MTPLTDEQRAVAGANAPLAFRLAALLAGELRRTPHADRLHDAAVDMLLCACRHWDAGRGIPFGAFAGRLIARRVIALRQRLEAGGRPDCLRYAADQLAELRRAENPPADPDAADLLAEVRRLRPRAVAGVERAMRAGRQKRASQLARQLRAELLAGPYGPAGELRGGLGR